MSSLDNLLSDKSEQKSSSAVTIYSASGDTILSAEIASNASKNSIDGSGNGTNSVSSHSMYLVELPKTNVSESESQTSGNLIIVNQNREENRSSTMEECKIAVLVPKPSSLPITIAEEAILTASPEMLTVMRTEDSVKKYTNVFEMKKSDEIRKLEEGMKNNNSPSSDNELKIEKIDERKDLKTQTPIEEDRRGNGIKGITKTNELIEFVKEPEASVIEIKKRLIDRDMAEADSESEEDDQLKPLMIDNHSLVPDHNHHQIPSSPYDNFYHHHHHHHHHHFEYEEAEEAAEEQKKLPSEAEKSEIHFNCNALPFRPQGHTSVMSNIQQYNVTTTSSSNIDGNNSCSSNQCEKDIFSSVSSLTEDMNMLMKNEDVNRRQAAALVLQPEHRERTDSSPSSIRTLDSGCDIRPYPMNIVGDNLTVNSGTSVVDRNSLLIVKETGNNISNSSNNENNKNSSGDDNDANSTTVDVPEIKEIDTLSPLEIPDEKLCEDIVEQVEYYFSNESILKDAFLLKHVRRNKEGFVSLKLISSFKRVRQFTKDWRVVGYAVRRKSKKIELNELATKIRRLEPLPTFDETMPSRTIVVCDLPVDKVSIEKVTEIFSKCGEIALVRILRPGMGIPVDVRQFMNKYPEMQQKECALVEFTESYAARIAKSLNGNFKVYEMVAPKKKTGKKAQSMPSSLNQQHSVTRLIENYKYHENNYERSRGGSGFLNNGQSINSSNMSQDGDLRYNVRRHSSDHFTKTEPQHNQPSHQYQHHQHHHHSYPNQYGHQHQHQYQHEQQQIQQQQQPQQQYHQQYTCPQRRFSLNNSNDRNNEIMSNANSNINGSNNNNNNSNFFPRRISNTSVTSAGSGAIDRKYSSCSDGYSSCSEIMSSRRTSGCSSTDPSSASSSRRTSGCSDYMCPCSRRMSQCSDIYRRLSQCSDYHHNRRYSNNPLHNYERSYSNPNSDYNGSGRKISFESNNFERKISLGSPSMINPNNNDNNSFSNTNNNNTYNSFNNGNNNINNSGNIIEQEYNKRKYSNGFDPFRKLSNPDQYGTDKYGRRISTDSGYDRKLSFGSDYSSSPRSRSNSFLMCQHPKTNIDTIVRTPVGPDGSKGFASRTRRLGQIVSPVN